MASVMPISNYPLSSHASLANQFVGQKLESVPTPAVVLDRAIIRRNCDAMLNVCKELGVGFRAHVKSHKVRFYHSLLSCDIGLHWDDKERGIC
jgi:hypothetical protein